MTALDMSVLCRDWTPTLADRETVASLPLDKELTLSVSLRANGEDRPCLPWGVEEGDARALILSASVDDVTLFELRFWDGRLRLNAGTGVGQESELILGADRFDFQVSFNPPQGGLAIVASWVMPSNERGTHAFTANISNLKLPKAKYYTLRLGSPKHFVDLSLLGWRVSATFDLAPPVTSFPSDLLEFVPSEDWRLEEGLLPVPDLTQEQESMLAELFLGYNPATERVVCREPGRLVVAPISTDAQTSRTTSALVETSPLDTLRLALQSIDSWRKVAEGALQELEGEGK